MSLRDAIYKHLSNDSILRGQLAMKPQDLGTGPAIFETWAAPGTKMPYINLTYSFRPGAGLFKREGTLDVDIFIDGNDSTRIEAIQKRVIQLLDLQQLPDPEDGITRIYFDTENDIPAESEAVLHWNITFNLVNWREGFIRKYINS